MILVGRQFVISSSLDLILRNTSPLRKTDSIIEPMHDSDLPQVCNIEQPQFYSSQRLARSQGKWYNGFGMMHHSDQQQV
jgi:hypothetical protein